MANIIEKSVDTIMQGLDSLKNIKKDKQDYKEQMARVKALPKDYEYVYNKIVEYMWSMSGGGDGLDMIALQAGLLELFEESVAQGMTVLEVTGKDVAAFCDELLRNAKTYSDDMRQSLNKDILKRLDK